jgi:hypothetical protein
MALGHNALSFASFLADLSYVCLFVQQFNAHFYAATRNMYEPGK